MGKERGKETATAALFYCGAPLLRHHSKNDYCGGAAIEERRNKSAFIRSPRSGSYRIVYTILLSWTISKEIIFFHSKWCRYWDGKFLYYPTGPGKYNKNTWAPSL